MYAYIGYVGLNSRVLIYIYNVNLLRNGVTRELQQLIYLFFRPPPVLFHSFYHHFISPSTSFPTVLNAGLSALATVRLCTSSYP